MGGRYEGYSNNKIIYTYNKLDIYTYPAFILSNVLKSTNFLLYLYLHNLQFIYMKKKYYLLLVFYPEGKKLDIVDVDQYLEIKHNFTKLFESYKRNEVIEYYKEYKKHFNKNTCTVETSKKVYDLISKTFENTIEENVTNKGLTFITTDNNVENKMTFFLYNVDRIIKKGFGLFVYDSNIQNTNENTFKVNVKFNYCDIQ